MLESDVATSTSFRASRAAHPPDLEKVLVGPDRTICLSCSPRNPEELAVTVVEEGHNVIAWDVASKWRGSATEARRALRRMRARCGGAASPTRVSPIISRWQRCIRGGIDGD